MGVVVGCLFVSFFYSMKSQPIVTYVGFPKQIHYSFEELKEMETKKTFPTYPKDVVEVCLVINKGDFVTTYHVHEMPCVDAKKLKAHSTQEKSSDVS